MLTFLRSLCILISFYKSLFALGLPPLNHEKAICTVYSVGVTFKLWN